MSDPASQLRELEQMLLDPAVRRDSGKLSALLAEEFREFGKSGRVYSRAEVIAELLQMEPDGRRITMQDFACITVAEGVALVTYCTVHTAPAEAAGNAAPIRALRSSLWVFREARWQMLFHQGTRAPGE